MQEKILPRVGADGKGPKLGGNLSPVVMMPSAAGTFRLHFAVALKPALQRQLFYPVSGAYMRS